MATAAGSSPALTVAGKRYLEENGDPLVMNTYLRICVDHCQEFVKIGE